MEWNLQNHRRARKNPVNLSTCHAFTHKTWSKLVSECYFNDTIWTLSVPQFINQSKIEWCQWSNHAFSPRNMYLIWYIKAPLICDFQRSSAKYDSKYLDPYMMTRLVKQCLWSLVPTSDSSICGEHHPLTSAVSNCLFRHAGCKAQPEYVFSDIPVQPIKAESGGGAVGWKSSNKLLVKLDAQRKTPVLRGVDWSL